MRERTKTVASKPRRQKARAVAAAPKAERPDHAALSELQRSAGNSAVALAVQRDPGDLAAAAPTHPTLRSGAHGRDVSDLQAFLNRIDDVKEPLDTDSRFGRLTEAAVREFQGAHSLKATGVADPDTWAALEDERARPQDPSALARKTFERGEKAFGAGDYAHAYDFFTRSDEIEHHPETAFSRAQCLRDLGGRDDEAVKLFEQYLAALPAGNRAKDAKDAIAELHGPGKTGTADDNKAAEAQFRKGEKLFEQHHYALAYDFFTRADGLLHLPEITFNRAQALHLLGGRDEEAIQLYEQYVTEKPDGSRVKDAKTNLDDLRGPGKTGTKDDNKSAEAQFRKGEKLYEAGQYALAYDFMTRADKLLHLPEITFSRAQCLRALGGRRDEAIALFQQYLTELPDGSRARDAKYQLDELRQEGASL